MSRATERIETLIVDENKNDVRSIGGERTRRRKRRGDYQGKQETLHLSSSTVGRPSHGSLVCFIISFSFASSSSLSCACCGSSARLVASCGSDSRSNSS